MRKLLLIILGAIAISVVCATVSFNVLSLSMPMQAKETLSCNPDEDEWAYFDTVMSVGGKVIGWGGYYIPMKLMFDGEEVCDNPLVRVDTVSPTVCRLKMVTKQEDFDLTEKDVMARLRQFNKPLEGFCRYQKVYIEHFDSAVNDEGQLQKQNTIYAFTLDYPKEDFIQRVPVLRWLCDMISVAHDMDVEVPEYTDLYIGYNPSKYKGQVYTGDAADIERFAEFATNKAFTEWRNADPGIMDIHIVTDYRAHIVNDKYVTYGAYVHSNQEPAHGMYTEEFYTYDLKGNQMVNNDYLFKEGSLDKVRKLIFAEIAKDDIYRYFNPEVETAEDVAQCIAEWNSDPVTDMQGVFDIPQGALTNEGVVFSFQPYEISGFAAGAFHITVPYSKLKPYLTTAAKNLIKK